MKKDNKTRQIAILERILSYAEFEKKHLPELQVLVEKLKKLKYENDKRQENQGAGADNLRPPLRQPENAPQYGNID